jgi:hypothetical protein
MYNTVVIAAQAIIYGQGSGDLVKQRVLASKGDPKELGHIAAMIVMSVQGGAKKEGKDIPTDVLFAAGQEVVADIVELAVAAKLVKPGDEEDVFKKTLFEGLRVYGNVQMATGQVSMADRHDAASQLLEIHRDDPNTKLGDLADKMMSGGGQGEADQQQAPEEDPTMSGILAAAIAGAVGGAGAGVADVGKDQMLQDNLKLKADLDQQREVRLQEMRNASAADVANIHGDTARDVADTGAAASGYAAETAAGAHEYGADTVAEASKYGHDTSAAATRDAARIHAGATIKAAELHADVQRDIARNVQTDADGNLLVIKDGQAQYVEDEDGNRVKSKNDITPGNKLLIEGLQKQVTELTRDLNDPAKSMYLDEPAKKQYGQTISQLQGRIFDIMGVDPSNLRVRGGSAGASGARPPLSSFERK